MALAVEARGEAELAADLVCENRLLFKNDSVAILAATPSARRLLGYGALRAKAVVLQKILEFLHIATNVAWRVGIRDIFGDDLLAGCQPLEPVARHLEYGGLVHVHVSPLRKTLLSALNTEIRLGEESMSERTMFSELRVRTRQIAESEVFGKVLSIGGLELEVAGLGAAARMGGHVKVADRIRGEIVAVDRDVATVLPFGTWEGVALADDVRLIDAGGDIYPDESWLGRVLDAFGQPLDDALLCEGPHCYPPRAVPPEAFQRRSTGKKLETRIKAIDAFTPICRGQRLGVFAGSGVGKSTLMAMLARQIDADVIVIGLVGERGREVQDFISRDLGPEGMARSVLVVATSDQPPLTRRQAAWTATAIAEFLRDQGQHVLLMIDSVTRFAMAQREIGLAAGEPPTSRGYTPTVFAELPRLLERSGPGRNVPGQGDITAIYTVLVDGDDHNEPIADTVRGILDGHIILDRKIAEGGRYPAIDIAKSVSRALPHCHAPAERAIMTSARRALALNAEMEDLVRIGAYRAGGDARTDAAIQFASLADGFLCQASSDSLSADETFATLYGLLDEAGLPLSPEELAAG